LWRQCVGAGAVLAYSFIVTYIIGFVLHKTIGLRITDDDELAGIDVAEHAEAAYELETTSGSFMGVGKGAIAGYSEVH
jgi:Amt family ammonium transporter